eukprot:gene7708-15775_t
MYFIIVFIFPLVLSIQLYQEKNKYKYKYPKPSIELSAVLDRFQQQNDFQQYFQYFQKLHKGINPCPKCLNCSDPNIRIPSYLGCCYMVTHLYDVMVHDGVFVVYTGSKSDSTTTSSHTPTPPIPKLIPLLHRSMGTTWESHVEVKVFHSKLPLDACKSYLSGTLHVSGRKTMHKLFHLQYAQLPRMSLRTNVTVISSTTNATAKLLEIRTRMIQYTYDTFRYVTKLPHFEMYKVLFDQGEIDLDEAHGMCFRRVAWGSGLRIHYVDSMVLLRRLTADFARQIAMTVYNPLTPQPFIRYTLKINENNNDNNNITSSQSLSPSQSQSQSHLLIRNGRPLRIVLLARIKSRIGRTLNKMRLILSRLTQAGAVVYRCDVSHSSMSSQIQCVAHADVIIGLHGAALVNAIFAPRGCILVELKTLYGYTTDIFTRTADSREGMYIHIDIRNYSKPKQYNEVNDTLCDTVLGAIVYTMRIRDLKNQSNGLINTSNGKVYHLIGGENYAIAPSDASGVLGHVLGPPPNILTRVCTNSLPYAYFRQHVLKGDKMEHCGPCYKEHERVF